MRSPVRFGIIGCGVIGRAHAEALASLPEATLVAVTDVDRERADALAQQYGARPYTDLDDMLDVEDLDVVNVCTASGMHGEHACAVMRSGRHVIVEKPMEIRSEAIDEMLRVQEEAGVKLAVIFQHRFDPAARDLHQLIEGNALGRLVAGNAHVLWWRSQEYYDSGAWRGTWALDGGGVLMNQGIHSIDLLQWFMGPVRAVCAYTDTLTHRVETEDVAVAVLRFHSGALGTIVGTTSAYPGVTTRVEVFGDAGSAIVERDRLHYLRLLGDGQEPAGAYGLEMREPPPLPAPAPQGGAHADQIADMIRAIGEGDTPLVDGHAGRHAVEIILAVYESARTGKEVLL